MVGAMSTIVAIVLSLYSTIILSLVSIEVLVRWSIETLFSAIRALSRSFEAQTINGMHIARFGVTGARHQRFETSSACVELP